MAQGVLFWVLIVVFHQDFSLLFTINSVIKDMVSRMVILLAFMIFFNSVQPILSRNALAFLVYSTCQWESAVLHPCQK